MLVVDPVCRMIISKENSEYTSKHKGIKYYFCAPSCKREFDEQPEESLRLYRLLSGVSVHQTEENCTAIEKVVSQVLTSSAK
jgi:YHS domain-containing protein